jgi:Transposase DDE domain
MCNPDRILVQLLRAVDRIPEPPSPPRPRKRGRPVVYSDRLFLKALIIMIVKRLPRVNELLSVLQQSAEMQEVRALLFEQGRFPCQRTFDRRLSAIPATLPGQIACLGKHLLQLFQPWLHSGRAGTIDSTPLRASGPPWHKKDSEKGHVPHSKIDTEAGWTKSGWHGWVWGWKLHLVVTAARVWIPLAARLCPANEADNKVAPDLISDLPEEMRFLLGDVQYNADNVSKACATSDLFLVTTQRGPHPHTDPGVEVRRLFHSLRSRTIENFNEHLKAIFDIRAQVPTKGLVATQRYVLGAVFVYQLALLLRHEQGFLTNAGLKHFLKAA